ncbi:flagellar hook protein FlgE [Erwinia pyrifoliae]|uniref:Flagellar hook protein FlgE n=1 Tax=Erwinia pyrifoliae TaxID=79967 RepID=A0ABY5X3U7_ERWPY|nr:flagellar hook protein FlgE [Erwinia pyrifoliae]MCT2388676.1 flagellar hook protein FlgE [Erwinia pyrifoliae]MCU8586845.1 flagellar hook protein FlgE [Erwinia pyrifoliae]UWS30720.1 flagellar hook protein FlgE [Erwinia pyrifoliae]UWS32055.1 flagellar hook protein FlgE [Erwinia pyrifoliae]UXK13733.1 flagellar hook protein FlgE [Erwinia pyrifoliae]
MGFSQAVSGLNAASSNLDVIGNNISNSATAGFKSSTVAFADMFAGSKVGLGTKVASVVQDFNDGTTTNTSRGLDVAISSAGFFRMADANGGVFYSRNGQFTLDQNRNIVNMQGLHLTGYPATGTPPTVQTGANPVALSVPATAMAAKATTTAAMTANLNSTDAVKNYANLNINDSTTYNAKSSMTAFDSLGNAHTVNLYFVKTADNNWTVHPVDASTGTAGADTNLVFNANGQLVTPNNGQVSFTMGQLNGSNGPTTLNVNLTGSQQQNNGKSTFGNPTQDGYKPGELTSYQINDDGTLVGTYSNEQTQVLGQIVLSNFANPEGLKSEGDNVWSASAASGQALSGIAGTGNLGTLTAGALESSNVDLSKELVNMIVAQRNYQSNAQTIKTQDQILNTLVNLR